MGGGASSLQQGVEELLTTTIMISRAIQNMTNPSVYRIHDFHSEKAPPLKAKNNANFAFFAMFGDDDEDDDDENVDQSLSRNNQSGTDLNPEVYSKFFQIKSGEDLIYIEDVLKPNQSGWLPLHSCCMSFITISAALSIIEYTVEHDGDLNVKTLYGPGSFNSGYTPLHMACAYGLETIVERLVNEGAEVNTFNSFGFTPLIEATQRGFIGIVTQLVKSNGIDLNYIPPQEIALKSPFVNSPPQSALGEAARAGFHRIVQILIDAGAMKDKVNENGCSPLHEACFHNRIETVKVLLVNGANPCLRTKSGALPYHLCSYSLVRTMIVDIGGPTAKPRDDDEAIDEISILREMTMVETAIVTDFDGNVRVLKFDSPNLNTLSNLNNNNNLSISSSNSSSFENIMEQEKRTQSSNQQLQTPIKSESKYSDDVISSSGKEAKLSNSSIPKGFLHSGGVLGDLPSLPTQFSPSSPQKLMMQDHNQLNDKLDSILSDNHESMNILKADEKVSKIKNKKSKKNKIQSDIPDNVPEQFLCQLTQKLMSEPVKSIYGHTYQKSAILAWIKQQGRICPLSGAPLSEIDLKPATELVTEINNWLLQRSSNPVKPDDIIKSSDVESTEKSKIHTASSNTTVNTADDLYDF